MSDDLVSAWRDAGGDAALEVFLGVGHAFANFPGPAADRCIERMRSVLAARLAAGAVVPAAR